MGTLRPRPGRTRDSVLARALDRAVKALNLVLQSGGFGLVALDIADVPLDALRELPFNTWMRLHRVVDASDTACVLVAEVPEAPQHQGCEHSAATATSSRRVAGW